MQLINISENLSKIEIEKFAEEIVLKNIIVKFFGNEFIVLYKNKNKNIDIFMINQGNRILFEQNNCIKSSNVTKILLMNLACANKTIYVYAEFLNNNKKESEQAISCLTFCLNAQSLSQKKGFWTASGRPQDRFFTKPPAAVRQEYVQCFF